MSKPSVGTAKARLIRRIRAIEDPALIEHMDALLEPGSEAWWQSLPPKVQTSVKKGMEQADRGEFIPVEEVQRARAQWRKR